jgi:hypothetical protein
LQVHGDGFRAEHACVVTLGYPPDTSPEARATLSRVAARYRVELVPLARLEEAASRHGTPLPDNLRPAVGSPGSQELPVPDVSSMDWHSLVGDRSPDATSEQVGSARSKHRPSSLIREPQQLSGFQGASLTPGGSSR